MAMQLFFVGVVLLIIEGFIPGFGIFGISGILCLLGSLYFFLLLVLVLLGWWLIRQGPGSWLGRQVTLHLRSTAARGYTGNAERKDLLGKTGVAQTVLRPSGRALIDGELVDVITEGEFYEPGTAVRVVAVTGGRNVVRKEEKI